MRIVEFSVQHKLSFSPKKVIDNNYDVNIFHSVSNSTGKTTLVRAILYTLGFNIPDTELIKFSNYEFCLKLVVKENEFNICRKGALITINGNEFDLPVDEIAVRSLLFGITNHDLLNNLLGAIYFDQEKGWTLLNRGTIIGINRFAIENFFRGLNNDDSSESLQLESELKAINKKIAQYNLMANVAEFQTEIQQTGNMLCENTFDEKLDKELLENKQRLGIVERELGVVNEIIKKNKSFVDFLEQKKIYVSLDNGSVIRVTRKNLFNYEPVFDSNEARKSLLIAERNVLRRRIADIESTQEKQLTFETLPSVDKQLMQRLSEIKTIGAVEVKKILDGLKKEKERLSKRIIERTRFNNLWINEVCETAKKYAEELRIPDKYKIDIFTHKLKSKSGAILHKLVFIYKLAYIKALTQKIGYPVPIILDSPNGREVESSTIKEMLSIIKRDFSEHQLLIATICDYTDIFNDANIFTMDGTLFDQESMFDLLKKKSDDE